MAALPCIYFNVLIYMYLCICICVSIDLSFLHFLGLLSCFGSVFVERCELGHTFPGGGRLGRDEEAGPGQAGGGDGRGSPTYIAPMPCVSTSLLALVNRAILIKGGVEGDE